MAIVLEATERKDLGRGASRRLRRAEMVPAVITGGKDPAISITIDGKKLILACLNDEFYKGCTLKLNGKEINVKPVEIQRHPVSEAILHVDFLRV
ncbi:MAG: 50S ribosomal protein L25 [Aeromonadales bacterium]|nr:50S ribosomal protein L25 [Aeromonadales bacterium]MDY2890369.1 50S ribosomal protein L25 [Succinivibrio sp.]